MLPCSMRQIVETGRLGQRAALVAADRERRVRLATTATPDGDTAARERRPSSGRTALAAVSLTAVLAAVARALGAYA